MTTRPLFKSSYLRDLGRYGDTRGGSSSKGNTHLFEDGDTGRRFIAKAASSQIPFGAFNESVAAILGGASLVSMPEHLEFEHDGLLWSASVMMTKAKIGDHPPDAVRACPIFRECIAQCLAFDLWILNEDRHTGNFFVHEKDGHYPVTLFDHDRAILSTGSTLANMRNRISQEPRYLIKDSMLTRVFQAKGMEISRARVHEAVEIVQAIPESVVVDAVRVVPPIPQLTVDIRNGAADLLLERARLLHDVVDLAMNHVDTRSYFTA